MCKATHELRTQRFKAIFIIYTKGIEFTGKAQPTAFIFAVRQPPSQHIGTVRRWPNLGDNEDRLFDAASAERQLLYC